MDRCAGESGLVDDLSLAVIALDAVDRCFRAAGLWRGNVYLAGADALSRVLELVGVEAGEYRDPLAVVRELAALELAYLFPVAGKFRAGRYDGQVQYRLNGWGRSLAGRLVAGRAGAGRVHGGVMLAQGWKGELGPAGWEQAWPVARDWAVRAEELGIDRGAGVRSLPAVSGAGRQPGAGSVDHPRGAGAGDRAGRARDADVVRGLQAGGGDRENGAESAGA